MCVQVYEYLPQIENLIQSCIYVCTVNSAGVTPCPLPLYGLYSRDSRFYVGVVFQLAALLHEEEDGLQDGRHHLQSAFLDTLRREQFNICNIPYYVNY
jgi:hypothetical protein